MLLSNFGDENCKLSPISEAGTCFPDCPILTSIIMCNPMMYGCESGDYFQMMSTKKEEAGKGGRG